MSYRKYYNRPDMKWQKQREIDFYRKLYGVPHFPDLEAADDTSIDITDCGHQITADYPAVLDYTDLGNQLGEITTLLGEAGIRHRDITANNLCWTDGVLYLVDFGWSIWSHEEDSPEPVPQVMRWWMCDKTDSQQALDTMLKLMELKG